MNKTAYRIWDKSVGKLTIEDNHNWSEFCLMPDGKLYEISMVGKLIDVEPDEYVIEAFTGCKDKNGKPIFENDIAKFTDHNYDYKGIFIIKWTNDTGLGSNAGFALFTKDEEMYDMPNVSSQLEVIGNSHVNPELLENQ